MTERKSKAALPSWAIAAALAGLFIWVLSPFLLSILMAGFVAATVEPTLRRFQRRRGGFRGLWATLIILGIYLLVTLPMIFGAARLVAQINENLLSQSKDASTMQSLMALKTAMELKINGILSSMGLSISGEFSKITQQGLQKGLTFLGQMSSTFLMQLPDLALSLLIFTATLFFFLTEAERMKKFVIGWNLLEKEDLNYFLDITKRSCRSILLSTFLIGGIQAGIVAGASLFLGTHEFFLIFVVTFFCSLIPIIGAAPVAIVMALSAFFNDAAGIGIAWLVVAVIAGTIDNIVKPFVIKTEEEIHPFITLLSVLGGVALWGFVGLFAGPLIATLAIAAIPRFASRD